MSKARLRKEVRTRLASLSAASKAERSSIICHSLKRHIALSGARVVALFSPLADEPQIWPLVEELSKSMCVALPRVEGDVMRFYAFGGETAPGAFGIMEPSSGLEILPHEIELIVVPGVAFTEEGARMGRGKGFYDKYMSHEDFSALRIGVCYAEQLVGEIPLEEHDVRMNSVVYA